MAGVGGGVVCLFFKEGEKHSPADAVFFARRRVLRRVGRGGMGTF